MKTFIVLLLVSFQSSLSFAETLKPADFAGLLGPWASLAQSLNDTYCSLGIDGLNKLPPEITTSAGKTVTLDIRATSKLIQPPDPMADPYFKDETTIKVRDNGEQGFALKFDGTDCLPTRVSLINRTASGAISSNIWEKQNGKIVDINHPKPSATEASSDCNCTTDSGSFKQIKSLKDQSNKIIAAIIDDGVDYNHADLAAKIPRENLGYDFDGGTSLPYPSIAEITDTEEERDTHGTHIAGIIAKNNSTVQIMALKANTFMNTSGVVSAIEYASKKGVRVVNMSFGSCVPEKWKSVNQAIKNHPEMIFVVAAGNGGLYGNKDQRNNDESSCQVSPTPLPHVIHVAAVNSQGKLADFSRYGKATVEISAPGVDISSAKSGGGQIVESGTSMAAPQITRIVSLVLAVNPNLNPAQVREILKASVTKQPDLEDKLIWGGSANEAKALALAKATLRKSK